MLDLNTRARALARRFIAVFALAGIGALTSISPAAPEPAPVPKRWQLDIDSSPLRLTVVDVPNQGPRAFFYMTYKVTNNSATDLLFAPAFELATDEMVLLRSGRDVPASVTTELIERMQNPLLEDPIKVVGNLLRGAENAKESIAIWPMPATFQSEAQVYAAGFSGETATVEVKSPATGSTEKKLLRKTQEMRFRLPGELNPSVGLEIDPFERRWIMR